MSNIQNDTQVKMANEMVVDAYQNNDPVLIKRASDAMNGYIRTQILEDSFMRQILPAVTITNDELDNSLDLRKPWKIIEVEPNSVGAMTVQFGTVPDTYYPEGKKVPVYFNRVLTPAYTKDVDELRCWKMDLRQILCDKQTKLMAWEEDRRFINAVENAIKASISTAAGKTSFNPFGLAVRFSQGLTRSNLIDMMGIMERTPNHLQPAKLLMNTTTRREFMKLTHEDVGQRTGDLLFNGISSSDFQGVEIVATNKNDLVPDGRIYQFADPKFLGKHYLLQDTTMYVENKAFQIKWFQYKASGAMIANLAALAMVDANPRGLSDDMQAISFT